MNKNVMWCMVLTICGLAGMKRTGDKLSNALQPPAKIYLESTRADELHEQLLGFSHDPVQHKPALEALFAQLHAEQAFTYAGEAAFLIAAACEHDPAALLQWLIEASNRGNLSAISSLMRAYDPKDRQYALAGLKTDRFMALFLMHFCNALRAQQTPDIYAPGLVQSCQKYVSVNSKSSVYALCKTKGMLQFYNDFGLGRPQVRQAASANIHHVLGVFAVYLDIAESQL